MPKIAIVITNRAPYGRLKSVIDQIHNHERLSLQLIVAGSALLDKYGSISDLIPYPFYKIYTHVDGDRPSNMVDGTAMLMQKLTSIWENDRPDVVIVHADRYEQLAVAITASYMNIKLAHTQGGESTGSIDDKVRNAITELADIHFVSTDGAEKKIDKDFVYNVGCPSIDIIPKNLEITNETLIKYKGVGKRIDLPCNYNLIMYHPNTREYGDMYFQAEQLAEAVDTLKKPTIWLWSNPDAGSDDISSVIRRYRENGKLSHVWFVKAFAPEDFYRVLANCDCLIGNTSTGIREGSYLGVPYVCIGTRQEGRETYENTVQVECISDAIVEAVNERMLWEKVGSDMYGLGIAGRKIALILDVLIHTDRGIVK